MKFTPQELQEIAAKLPEPTRRRLRDLLVRSLCDVETAGGLPDDENKIKDLHERAQLAQDLGDTLQEIVVDKIRCWYARGFLLLGLLLILTLGFLKLCPGLQASVPEHVARYSWCLSWVFIGFSAIVFRSSKKFHANRATRTYLSFYLPTLLLLASAVMGVFAIASPDAGHGFFYLAAPVSAGLGFSVDQVVSKVFRLEIPFSV